MKNRWLYPLLLLISLSLPGWAAEVTLQLPPESLADWYKPANKRQVWLHTMFRLRREMQAVIWYNAREDVARLGKWSARFEKDYRSIGKLVPEWQDELELEWLERLQSAAAGGDFSAVGKALRKLQASCGSCHREYRAVAALRYRTADFSLLAVEDSETLEEIPYDKAMGRLSTLVNRIKIASVDGDVATGLASVAELTRRMRDLATGCVGCHEDADPRERILGSSSERLLEQMTKSIQAGEQKQTGRQLGELAVTSCARCHGVHRTLYDIRKEIMEY